jgi:hypothetical protein
MTSYFDCPCLAEGSDVRIEGKRVTINCGRRSFVADFPSVDDAVLGALFAGLAEGGRRMDDLRTDFSSVSVSKLVSSLDDFGLLSESGAMSKGALSGKQLISRLEQEYLARLEKSGTLPLWDILRSGDADHALLTGLAKEYYFLTAAAYDAVTPAIASMHGMQKLVMIEFVLGEYRHDRLMLKSLKSCGLTDEDVMKARPHPYTRGLTDLLRYWAETDPLTMMCALFIFEGTEDGGKAYIDLLRRNALPEGYIDGVVEHDRANSEGNHGLISREFMSHQTQVSAEDAERVSSRLLDLHKLMDRRNIEVSATYWRSRQAA